MTGIDLEGKAARLGAGADRIIETVSENERVKALLEEAATWREWVDEMRLQGALGKMEGRDRRTIVSDEITNLRARLKGRVHELESRVHELESRVHELESREPIPGLSEELDREFEHAAQELGSPEVFSK